jgi:hypothetical protein
MFPGRLVSSSHVRFGVARIRSNRSLRHSGGTALSNTSASEAQKTKNGGGRGLSLATASLIRRACSRSQASGLRRFASLVSERVPSPFPGAPHFTLPIRVSIRCSA